MKKQRHKEFDSITIALRDQEFNQKYMKALDQIYFTIHSRNIVTHNIVQDMDKARESYPQDVDEKG